MLLADASLANNEFSSKEVSCTMVNGPRFSSARALASLFSPIAKVTDPLHKKELEIFHILQRMKLLVCDSWCVQLCDSWSLVNSIFNAYFFHNYYLYVCLRRRWCSVVAYLPGHFYL